MSRVIRSVKNVVKNRTIPEVKCIEATSNDPWFPSTIELDELAQHTYHPKSQHEIYQILYRRLNDQAKNWRHVLKSLIVFEYLIFHGHTDMYKLLSATSAVMNSLTMFMFVDTEGKDKGNYIRERAKRMVKYIEEPQFFQTEKEKALKLKRRVQGDLSIPGNNLQFQHGSQIRASAPDYAPKNREEEDLQLQLALAISKQEAQEMQTQSYHSGSIDSNSDKFDAFPDSHQKQKPSVTNESATIQTQLIDIFSDEFNSRPSASVNNPMGGPSTSSATDFNSVFTNPHNPTPLYNDYARTQQPFSPFTSSTTPAPSYTPNPNENIFSTQPPIEPTRAVNVQRNLDPFDDFMKSTSPFQSITTNINETPKPHLPTQTETPVITSDAFRFVNDTGLVDLSFESMKSDRSSQQSQKKKSTLNELAKSNVTSGSYNPSQFTTPNNTPQHSAMGAPNTFMGFAQPQPFLNNNPFANDSSNFNYQNSQSNPNALPPFGTSNNSPFPDNPFDTNNSSNKRP